MNECQVNVLILSMFIYSLSQHSVYLRKEFVIGYIDT